MTAAVVERLSVPLGLDRRIRGMTRSRDYVAHTKAVMLARAMYLALHGGTVPRWVPGAGLKTSYPPKVRTE